MRTTKITGISAVHVLGGTFCIAQTGAVTIYLSVPIRNGFVDTGQEIQDSAGDISKRLGFESGI